MNIFAHASATADEMALELLSPYPVGISESSVIVILFCPKSFFETIFSTVLLIRRELRLLFLDLSIIPFPELASTVASTFNAIPKVAPFLIAIAFTREIAPCTVAFALTIKIHPAMLFSLHYKALSYRAKSQKILLLGLGAFHIHK